VDLINTIKALEEAKDPDSEKTEKVKSKKSRVRIYDTIADALKAGSYGQIFSTKGADRLYVITKPTWGSKSRAGGNTKVAKGFTPGSSTPSSKWGSVKSYAVRTMKKHGKQKRTVSTKKRSKKDN